MRWSRIIQAAAIAATLVATPALADEAIMLKVGYMSLAPSGQIAGGPTGTRLDAKSSLNLGRSNNVQAEAALQFGDHRLSVGYMPLKFTGTSVLTTNVNFNGTNYAIASPVSSSFKANVYDIAYTYYLLNMDDLPSRLQFGIEASVKITQAEASLTDLTTNTTQSVKATAPIPTLGARARVALADFLGLVGRVGYLGYAGNHFLDADAQVEFSPLPTLGVYGGYRYIDLKVDNAGVFASTKINGPYVGAFFRF